jgi:hypothetical protein
LSSQSGLLCATQVKQKWITVGARCASCGMLGAYVDWKIDYAPPSIFTRWCRGTASNKVHSLDAAMSFSLHIGRHQRRASDAQRPV